jgi:hypothetical protein
VEIFPAGCFIKKQDFLQGALFLSPVLRSPPLFGGRSPRPKGVGSAAEGLKMANYLGRILLLLVISRSGRGGAPEATRNP